MNRTSVARTSAHKPLRTTLPVRAVSGQAMTTSVECRVELLCHSCHTTMVYEGIRLSHPSFALSARMSCPLSCNVSPSTIASRRGSTIRLVIPLLAIVLVRVLLLAPRLVPARLLRLRLRLLPVGCSGLRLLLLLVLDEFEVDEARHCHKSGSQPGT